MRVAQPLLPILMSLLQAACGALLAAGAVMHPAMAASPAAESKPAWTSLSPAQQQALAPLQRDWPTIDADRKSKWLQVASRFPTMPPAERERVQQRMAEWSRLTPAERGAARIQFQQARQLPAQDRAAQWDAYQSLPQTRRQELAAQAKPPATSASAGTTSAPARSSVAKRNVIVPTPSGPPRAVSPTVVQARNGATTRLMSQPATPPVHQQAGLPKIAASEGFVQPKTLLPKRGPQGAAVRSTAASAPEATP